MDNIEYNPRIHSDEEFREQVVKCLSRLETQMQSLVGNGQPGRISTMEKQLDRHDTVLNRIIGAIILVGSGSGLALLSTLFSHIR